MNLLNRYINAIAVLLPRAQRSDIEIELRSTLLAQVENRQAKLGRALKTSELEAVLKENGHPLVVAARYQSNKPFIGLSILPFYRLALKVGLAAMLMARIVLSVIAVVSGQDALVVTVNFIQSLCVGGIEMIGGVTSIAMFLERFGYSNQVANALTDALTDWKPSRLFKIPALSPRPKAITLLLLDFIGIGALAVLLTRSPDSLATMSLPPFGEHILPATIWYELGRIALVVAIAQAVVHLVEVLRPTYTRVCAWANVAVKMGTVILLCAFSAGKPWVTISELPAEISQHANRNLNTAISIGIFILVTITVIQLVGELRRAVRRERAPDRGIEVSPMAL